MRDSFKIKTGSFIKIASIKLYEAENGIYDCNIQADIVQLSRKNELEREKQVDYAASRLVR